jgi:hypothetical protein
MPDESGPLLSLAQLLPSVYYDLIARVCAGVPFLALVLWTKRQSLDGLVSSSWVGFLLLLGAGYIVGLLLTPFTLFWSILIGLPTQIILFKKFREALWSRFLNKKSADGKKGIVDDFSSLWSQYDEIAKANKEAGTTIAKMAAEATLSQNLLSGFVVLIIADEEKMHLMPSLGDRDAEYRWAIFLALLASAIFRTVAYLGRQDGLYRDYSLDKKRASTT